MQGDICQSLAARIRQRQLNLNTVNPRASHGMHSGEAAQRSRFFPNNATKGRSGHQPVCTFRKTWANVCVTAAVGAFLCPKCESAVTSEMRCVACRKERTRSEVSSSGKDGSLIFPSNSCQAKNLESDPIDKPQKFADKILRDRGIVLMGTSSTGAPAAGSKNSCRTSSPVLFLECAE